MGRLPTETKKGGRERNQEYARRSRSYRAYRSSEILRKGAPETAKKDKGFPRYLRGGDKIGRKKDYSSLRDATLYQGSDGPQRESVIIGLHSEKIQEDQQRRYLYLISKITKETQKKYREEK